MESKETHFFMATNSGKIWVDVDKAFFLSESDDYLFEAVGYYGQQFRLTYYYNIDGELQTLTPEQEAFLILLLEDAIQTENQSNNAERPHNYFEYE